MASKTAMPRIVFGAAPVGNIDAYKTANELGPVIEILTKHKANTLDSAQLYGASEATIGTLSDSVKDDLVIDTKWLGGWKPGSATKSNIIETGKSSLSKLGVPQFDIFYLHAHDPDTPLSETLAGVNEVYKAGTFRRFGLSNFLAKTVREIYEICKSNNYVFPTVYQVNYSPVTRIPEDELFPLLRKLGIAIYAYSPIAGGLLAKSRAQVEAGEGRFSAEGKSQMYNEMYNRPTYLNMLDSWSAIADEVGCSRAELAYRWVAYHSALKADHGDGVIVGASSTKQLEGTLEGLEHGPLPQEAARKIDGLWEGVKGEAPVDNYHR